MWKFVIFICFTVLGYVFGIDREIIVADCAEKNQLSEEDLEKWINYQTSTDEKFLCFMLCCHQNDGSLKKDGKWNPDFLDQHLNEMYLINNTLKSQIMECFSSIPPIQNCQDMKAVERCIPELKTRNCSDEFDIRDEDFQIFARNPGDPSDKMLCYLKCSSENDDLIYEDGTLNLNFLKELIERSKEMGESEKKSVEECLSQVPPVKSCDDFRPFARCVANLRLF